MKPLRIAGMDYAVFERPGLEDFGTVDHETLAIEVRRELDINQTHETIHALEEAYGFSLPEDATRRLSRGLYAFMRDNPVFVKAVLDA